QGHLAGVHSEDPFTTSNIGSWNCHSTIKATRAQDGGIEHIRAIGCRHNDDALVRLKTVHLHQKLIECLLALIMTASQTSASVSTHRVDFINENDAGCVLLALLKKVPHATGTHAD